MNNKEKIVKAIEDKINELEVKNATIKTDKEGTVSVLIEKIVPSDGVLNVSVDKYDSCLLLSMDHIDNNKSYSRLFRGSNSEEVINLICAILNSHNLSGVSIRNDEVLKEFLGDEVFASLFYHTSNVCHPPYFDYLKNTQNRLDYLRDTIVSLMMDQNLICHMLHETSTDNTSQRYWIRIAE